MDIKIIILLVALANFLMGLLFFWKAARKQANIAFGVLSCFVGLWALGLYFYEHPLFFNSLIWLKIVYATVIGLIGALFYFSFVFPVEKKKKTISLALILYIISSIPFLFILFLSKLWVQEVIHQTWGCEAKLGPAYVFFGIFCLFFCSWFSLNLIRSYQKAIRINKLRLRYIFLGTIFTAFPILTIDVVFPIFMGNSSYFWLSPAFSLVLIGCIAYAVARHKLLDIRIPVTAIFVGIILIILIFNIFAVKTTTGIISLSISFVLIAIFGYFLIRTISREIEARERAYQALKRIDKAKSEFISITSHQLRTPLTAVKGYISMILEGTYGKLSEKIKSPIKNVYKSNERLIKMVNNLLSISRIEAGRMELDPKLMSLENVISSVIDELRIEAQKKKIYLKWKRSQKPLPKIWADREKIEQIILNVVDNAIRYTEKGGVIINVKSQDSKLKIIVSDTGAGMTEYELSKVFESFSRGLAGTRLYTEGVGLGLYIAKKFTAMHDGKIWAESKGKGKGSTFYIELPITRPSMTAFKSLIKEM